MFCRKIPRYQEISKDAFLSRDVFPSDSIACALNTQNAIIADRASPVYPLTFAIRLECGALSVASSWDEASISYYWLDISLRRSSNRLNLQDQRRERRLRGIISRINYMLRMRSVHETRERRVTPLTPLERCIIH